MRTFHRYAPAGLAEPSCGACGGRPTDEVHIAGMSEEIGAEMVQCPSCRRQVPTDFTVRSFVKQGSGPTVQRLCQDCLVDPEAGRSAACRAEAEAAKAEKLAFLMNARDRGDITEREYDERLTELL